MTESANMMGETGTALDRRMAPYEETSGPREYLSAATSHNLTPSLVSAAYLTSSTPDSQLHYCHIPYRYLPTYLGSYRLPYAQSPRHYPSLQKRMQRIGHAHKRDQIKC